MTDMKEPRAPKPSEYDLKKLRPYEFAPICEMHDCALRAGRAVQCNTCGSIEAWFCVPHAARLQTMEPTRSTCQACGAEDFLPELVHVVTLAGWF
jgi:hypothetical protein